MLRITILVLLVAVPAAAFVADDKRPAVPTAALGEWPTRASGQFVFFAVLEGLYADGVRNETVDLILAPDPETGAFRYGEHFVYGCPICNPAFEALRLYRKRDLFMSSKGEFRPTPQFRGTFGGGLSKEAVAGLRSPKRAERLRALEPLITRWIERRFQLVDMSEKDRAALRTEMRRGLKDGMVSLGRLRKKPGADKEWKECAICNGGVNGLRLPGEVSK